MMKTGYVTHSILAHIHRHTVILSLGQTQSRSSPPPPVAFNTRASVFSPVKPTSTQAQSSPQTLRSGHRTIKTDEVQLSHKNLVILLFLFCLTLHVLCLKLSICCIEACKEESHNLGHAYRRCMSTQTIVWFAAMEKGREESERDRQQ